MLQPAYGLFHLACRLLHLAYGLFHPACGLWHQKRHFALTRGRAAVWRGFQLPPHEPECPPLPISANSTRPAARWPGVSPVRPGWTKSPPQPGGRRKIAQHFSAGLGVDRRRVPQGRKKFHPVPGAVVPDGTFYRRTVLPSAEALGYFRSSLWDCQRQARSTTFSRAVREHGSSQQRSVLSRNSAPLS